VRFIFGNQKLTSLIEVAWTLTTFINVSANPGATHDCSRRSYKGTFIWCDVFDDDVILPLGESGEYVLKALEVYDASEGT